MSEKKVIILDETADEVQELSQEKLEELARNERLKKLSEKSVIKGGSIWSIASKVTNVIGLLGIMFSMLTVSGTALVVSLIILLVSTIVNYAFFKD